MKRANFPRRLERRRHEAIERQSRSSRFHKWARANGISLVPVRAVADAQALAPTIEQYLAWTRAEAARWEARK